MIRKTHEIPQNIIIKKLSLLVYFNDIDFADLVKRLQLLYCEMMIVTSFQIDTL